MSSGSTRPSVSTSASASRSSRTKASICLSSGRRALREDRLVASGGERHEEEVERTELRMPESVDLLRKDRVRRATEDERELRPARGCRRSGLRHLGQLDVESGLLVDHELELLVEQRPERLGGERFEHAPKATTEDESEPPRTCHAWLPSRAIDCNGCPTSSSSRRTSSSRSSSRRAWRSTVTSSCTRFTTATPSPRPRSR